MELMGPAWAYFWREESPYAISAALLLAALPWALRPADRGSVGYTLAVFVLCLAGQFAAGMLDASGLTAGAAALHELLVVVSGMALIRLGGLCLFRVLLPAAGLAPPRIVEDIVVILAYVGFALVRMRLAGVDLSGIVATSAVITAVAAFAMQDTLGNILGGLALQLDSSIQVGDWVRVDDIVGRVIDIRWRYTAIETRNGETVVVPNSLLMKSKFAVIWSPEQATRPWRRLIWFNVDYAVPPARVIQTVEQAMVAADIPNVRRDPLPNCVLMEFGQNYGRYALRYWMSDPRHDDPTDSVVRVHVLAALQRAGIRIAEPEYSVHMIKENEAYREAVHARELARRLKLLRSVDIFAAFSEEELKALADRLVYAPFARGDVVTRQGMVAHWLYILVGGEADVWLEQDGGRRLLTTLPAGRVFGEMGMLTGEPRRATVTARSDIECYRLDKAGFEDIIRSRPAIAEEMAAILAERNMQLAQAQEALGAEAREHERSRQHASLLGKMRAFFRLGEK
ncbi:MAG: mechanosensitive ion channel [Zoogloeaceae bacterium]|nr:mechanosensitive ion channel [Zoogloeaceae bacterium]MCK6384937.1 mechanosensitive ion channel family protein [Rhodocyclaceae bacterium]